MKLYSNKLGSYVIKLQLCQLRTYTGLKFVTISSLKEELKRMKLHTHDFRQKIKACIQRSISYRCRLGIKTGVLVLRFKQLCPCFRWKHMK